MTHQIIVYVKKKGASGHVKKEQTVGSYGNTLFIILYFSRFSTKFLRSEQIFFWSSKFNNFEMTCCARKRRRSRCAKKPKRSSCCKKGKLTNNPFLNFLRFFRIRHCGWPARKIAVEGAKVWCKMSKCQRKEFYKMARKKSKCKGGPLVVKKPCCKPPRRKRSRCARKRKRSCSRRRRKRSCSRRRRKRSCSRRRRKRSCSRRRRRRSCSRKRKRSCSRRRKSCAKRKRSCSRKRTKSCKRPRKSSCGPKE